MARAGFAKVVITPPLGVELCGYGVYLQRAATTVHDDLFVRALIVEDERGERVLLLSLDLVGLGQEAYAEIVRRSGPVVAAPADHVLVSCIHTHSGPATAPLHGWGEIEPSYVSTLPERCAAAAAQALGDLRPVRIGTAHGEVQALGFNRVRPDGPIDRGLHVLRIDTWQGQPYVALYSHGCHPVTIDRRTPAGTAISADWPGQVAQRLREQGYGEAMFLLGPCGDIDPVVAWHGLGHEAAALCAELVTQTLVALLRSVETGTSLDLRMAQDEVALPLQPLTERDIAAALAEAQTQYGSVRVTEEGFAADAWQRFYAAWAETARAALATQTNHLTATLAALLLNGEAWTFLPGEIFTSLGDRIRAESPIPRTVLTTLAGRYIGYIPDRDDFAAGGYASILAPRILRTPPYDPTVGNVIVASMVHVLHRLGEHS
jgi:Neutral/alkaline non-lysosomal ceramidase, N-terminal